MALSPRILLADDDSEVRLGVADLLMGIGLTVRHAETGLEAVEIVRRETVQAALLDMHMPGRTGIEVLPLLREQCEGLPCLVYSGLWTPGLEEAVLAAGALACLKKPVDPLLLRAEIRRALRVPPDHHWNRGDSLN